VQTSPAFFLLVPPLGDEKVIEKFQSYVVGDRPPIIHHSPTDSHIAIVEIAAKMTRLQR
jgi:hypothetical protein